jgi:hypothetical protein|tara:strand:- start:151 stop:357 length:207 start_codon:yes stop_codon:yes gene_type:complete
MVSLTFPTDFLAGEPGNDISKLVTLADIPDSTLVKNHTTHKLYLRPKPKGANDDTIVLLGLTLIIAKG